MPKWCEECVFGARAGVEGRGEDAPMVLGAEQDWGKEQGIPNTEVCLTP